MKDVRVGNGHSGDVLEVVGCFSQFDTLQPEGVIGDRRWLTMESDRCGATAKRNERGLGIITFLFIHTIKPEFRLSELIARFTVIPPHPNR